MNFLSGSRSVRPCDSWDTARRPHELLLSLQTLTLHTYLFVNNIDEMPAQKKKKKKKIVVKSMKTIQNKQCGAIRVCLGPSAADKQIRMKIEYKKENRRFRKRISKSRNDGSK